MDFWDEDNLSLSLFRYLPDKAGQDDEASQFILGFKNYDSNCFSAGARLVGDALGKFLTSWKDEYGCRYIVPVPSHRANQIPVSSAELCRILSGVFSIQYPEELLFRRETIIPAHMAYYGQRLTSVQHFRSLGCGGTNLGGAGVILFDDIISTGNTSQACKRQLQLYAQCGQVIRLFLGRTERE